MKFQIISDIKGNEHKVKFEKDADITILSGNIGKNIDATLSFLSNIPTPVYFTLNNTDFYGNDYDNVIAKVNRFCQKSKGRINLLNNTSFEVEGYRIIGSTLWSDFGNLDPFILESSWAGMLDYEMISNITRNKKEKELLIDDHFIKMKNIFANGDDYQKDFLFDTSFKRAKLYSRDQENIFSYNSGLFTPFDAYIIHKENEAWLKNEIKKEFNGKTIVVCSHSPSLIPLILENYPTSPFLIYNDRKLEIVPSYYKIGGYCSDKESIFSKSNVDLLVHGNFNTFLNYRISNTHVISNPLLSGKSICLSLNDHEKDFYTKDYLNKLIDYTKKYHFFIKYIIDHKYKTKETNRVYFIKAYWENLRIIIDNLKSIYPSLINNNQINLSLSEIEKYHDNVFLSDHEVFPVLSEIKKISEILFFILKEL